MHIVRRYNGEWISAAGPLAFDLSDWIVGPGDAAYSGTMSYYLETDLHACDCVAPDNRISLPAEATATPTDINAIRAIRMAAHCSPDCAGAQLFVMPAPPASLGAACPREAGAGEGLPLRRQPGLRLVDEQG